jgi:hypothetical protein
MQYKIKKVDCSVYKHTLRELDSNFRSQMFELSKSVCALRPTFTYSYIRWHNVGALCHGVIRIINDGLNLYSVSKADIYIRSREPLQRQVTGTSNQVYRLSSLSSTLPIKKLNSGTPKIYSGLRIFWTLYIV